jgi:hypothetical protein
MRITKTALPCFVLFAGVVSAGTIARADQTPAEVRQMDLRPAFDQYHLSIKLQGSRNTCHIFTLVAALEFAIACKFDSGVGLSEEYLNWAANEASGQPKDGANFTELAQALKKWGVCEERFMPYARAFDPKYRPSQAALESAREIHKLDFRWHWIKTPNTGKFLDDTHVEAIKKVLRLGWPVVAGREHNILVVGFSDNPRGGTFIIRNSNSRTYRTLTYDELKAVSSTALWVDLPLGD